VLYRLLLSPVTLSDANYPKPPHFRHNFHQPWLGTFCRRESRLWKVGVGLVGEYRVSLSRCQTSKLYRMPFRDQRK